MPDPVRVNGDKIEAHRPLGFVHFQSIGLGGSLQMAHFGLAHRFLGGSDRSLLDFDKDQHVPIERYEIELPVRHLPPPGDDRVSEADKVVRGAVFGLRP